MNDEADFYVGYLPNAPATLRRFVRRIIVLLATIVIVLGLVLVMAQMPFANSFFEFGKLRDFEGTITAQPYPSLHVQRPGQADPQQSTSEYLLVAPGKHGADELVRDLAGKHVKLRGQLIYRDGQTMLEVEPGSTSKTAMSAAEPQEVRDIGPLTVTGEIVDSKCYLGVMNPGNGKVHRDCASRCLSGGIPPLFVRFDTGDRYLLIDQEGRALAYDVIREFIAEPIIASGELLQRGGTQLLRIGPRELRHTAK